MKYNYMLYNALHSAQHREVQGIVVRYPCPTILPILNPTNISLFFLFEGSLDCWWFPSSKLFTSSDSMMRHPSALSHTFMSPPWAFVLPCYKCWFSVLSPLLSSLRYTDLLPWFQITYVLTTPQTRLLALLSVFEFQILTPNSILGRELNLPKLNS